MEMISIVKADESHADLLSDIAKITFIESHGHSARAEDIRTYVLEKYTSAVFEKELNDPTNVYHLLYYKNQPAGYSKIILNLPYATSKTMNLTKFERLYFLKEFYDLHLGSELFQFNIRLMKANDQAGVWLFVWKENQRAFNFYKKQGFVIIGSHDFKISETHSNPNHQMLLSF